MALDAQPHKTSVRASTVATLADVWKHPDVHIVNANPPTMDPSAENVSVCVCFSGNLLNGFSSIDNSMNSKVSHH